jgi:predicted TPR repeat methyltransferase
VTVTVDAAARRLARDLEIDEAADVVVWRDDAGRAVRTGLHDYAALYAVPGLYEAVYFERLGGRAPAVLAERLAEVVAEPAAVTVLDVGAGTGAVGGELWARGFRRIFATDLEPASVQAIERDRGELHAGARVCDLVTPSGDDRAWLRSVAPDVVTVAGAVGFGHLPVAAFRTLTERLGPGGLLALTVARGFEREPALAEHAGLFGGGAYRERERRDGLHRRTAAGGELLVTALVLERV